MQASRCREWAGRPFRGDCTASGGAPWERCLAVVGKAESRKLGVSPRKITAEAIQRWGRRQRGVDGNGEQQEVEVTVELWEARPVS